MLQKNKGTRKVKKIEFKVGDEVTFKPYEKACKVTVEKIIKSCDKIEYKVDGEALSVTTGQYIVESEYYKPEENK